MTRETVVDVLAAIESGEVSAEAAAGRALAAIEGWRELNAVARLDAERALAAARAVDRGERQGALAGLPIVVKDNIQVAGLPAAAGTPALAGAIAAANAPVVERLVEAGAVVVATTNMHELALGISGFNPTYRTGVEVGVRNPYDTGRFAGGSSSGTGALVGAGAVAAGLGTDTGGSVRVPAAVNGVAGLRPTVGRYPKEGIVPLSATRDTPGFIAATVADIEILDRVVTAAAPVGPADLAGLRLGVAASFTEGLGAEVAAVWREVLSRLAAAGVVLVEVDAGEIRRWNAEVSFPIVFHEARRDLRAYLERHAPGVSIEAVVAGILSADVRASYEGLVLPGKLPTPDGGVVDVEPAYRAAMREGRPALIAAYAAVFDAAGIEALVFPAVPEVAVAADEASSSLETFLTFIRNTDPASNAGLPGLVLPAGRGAATGLPVGIELDGPAGSDRRLLAIGMALEGVFGSLPPPSPPG
ncbi:MAG TPA: amidase family protein [Amaricoccus sp.]|nr:amidase family protein [Amaricoccus sp.]